ncbi:MAG TPA: Stp1/IreP family PP2C-type Ser/Thr phosphatase [Gaiellaceae bacterium]|jgi:protein phosphatase|nr:Stp1/IreP family PP2C-type Ser/Thr phosphatase [Gaiellaceae bacterium]
MRIAGSSAESNVGRKRRHNEDNFVAAPPVFAVADGMGGAQAGEVASELAAETVRETEFDATVSGKERVVALIKAANLRVHERASIDATASGMGTTMTVAMLQPDGTLAIGHVGDSRAYRLRDGELEQLTDDHSLVGELVRRGELTPEEAAVHPQRSVITRALGTEPDVDVDAFTVEARDGDVFLLCSDGLTTMVDPETIAAILRRNGTHLDAATHALIKAANDRGGDDNITAILFAVADGDADLAATVAMAPPVPDPDLEDTLHPEDDVRLPPVAPAEVTMVVSADELARALDAEKQPERVEAAPAEAAPVSAAAASVAAQSPTPERAPEAPAGEPAETSSEAPASDLTTAWPAVAPAAAAAAGKEEHSDDEEPDAPPEEKASPIRVGIAVLVIVLLVVAIVLLVLDALPR